MLLTIRSTADGLYAWDLHDGPDGAFHESGRAPTVNRCLTEISRARLAIAHHITDDLDPSASYQPNLPLHLPAPDNHSPHGHTLSAQQHIPALGHSPALTSPIYPHPSKSG